MWRIKKTTFDAKMASRKKKKACGPVCIIHYQQDKTDCKVQQIYESNFKKINEAPEVRKVQFKVS